MDQVKGRKDTSRCSAHLRRTLAKRTLIPTERMWESLEVKFILS